MTDSLHLEHLGACRTAFRDTPEACGSILLVGEDNPISSRPEHALFCAPANCSGERLQRLVFGLPRLQYLALWRTNLCVGGWKTKAARERARALISRAAPWTTIVALGRKVGDIFGDLSTSGFYGGPPEPFTVRFAVNDGVNQDAPTPLLRLVFLPHPSGRSRVWNREGAVETARNMMAVLAPELAWGTL